MIVQLDGFRELLELGDEIARRGQQPPQPNEGTHDLDINLCGEARVKHAGEHRHALLGEH